MKSIELKNITKKYGKVTALDNVSLTFEENKIYGLLGRNGAGKSTLMNIISGMIFQDEGDVYVDGEKAAGNDNTLRKIYIMNEKTLYPESMKISKVFDWTKNFYPDFDKESAVNMAEKFGLDLNKNIKSLSTGYTSIFKAIIALNINTSYILLDEPVLGLDANHRDLLYKLLIEKYSNNPCTIVISTHLIEEVSNVIENVVIIDKGTIVRNETCEELLSKGYTVTGSASKVDSYIKDKQIIGVDTLGGLKTAYILGSAEKEVPEGLEFSKLDLQKLFIQITNESEVK